MKVVNFILKWWDDRSWLVNNSLSHWEFTGSMTCFLNLGQLNLFDSTWTIYTTSAKWKIHFFLLLIEFRTFSVLFSNTWRETAVSRFVSNPSVWLPWKHSALLSSAFSISVVDHANTQRRRRQSGTLWQRRRNRATNIPDQNLDYSNFPLQSISSVFRPWLVCPGLKYSTPLLSQFCQIAFSLIRTRQTVEHKKFKLPKLQRWAKRLVCFAKQDPGRARQRKQEQEENSLNHAQAF